MPGHGNRFVISALTALAVALAGCGSSAPPVVMPAELTYPETPPELAAPCGVTPAPQAGGVTIGDALALEVSLRRDACACALRYVELARYMSGGRTSIEPPDDDQCPPAE